MKKFLFYTLICAIAVCSATAQNKYTYPFQNPSLATDTRVNDLVSRLTLEEKVSSNAQFDTGD